MGPCSGQAKQIAWSVGSAAFATGAALGLDGNAPVGIPVAIGSLVCLWVLQVPKPAGGTERYTRKLATKWRDWSLVTKGIADTAYREAHDRRGRVSRLRVPSRFGAEHELLLSLLTPLGSNSSAPERIQRRREIDDVCERISAAALRDEDRRYVRELAATLGSPDARRRAYERAAEATTAFGRSLEGMRVPTERTRAHEALIEAVSRYRDLLDRLARASGERDTEAMLSLAAELEAERDEFRALHSEIFD